MTRFRAPEALFQPSFLGIEASGIHETTYVFSPYHPGYVFTCIITGTIPSTSVILTFAVIYMAMSCSPVALLCTLVLLTECRKS